MNQYNVFVALGSQKFQFNRLLKAIDNICCDKYRFYAQIGYSTYIPKNYEYINFLDHDTFIHKITESDIVLCHAGTGIIINALKYGKKVLAVSRLEKYGEHVDNHQTEIIRAFNKKKYLLGVEEVDNLLDNLNEVIKANFSIYESSQSKFINSLIKVINNINV